MPPDYGIYYEQQVAGLSSPDKQLYCFSLFLDVETNVFCNVTKFVNFNEATLRFAARMWVSLSVIWSVWKNYIYGSSVLLHAFAWGERNQRPYKLVRSEDQHLLRDNKAAAIPAVRYLFLSDQHPLQYLGYNSLNRGYKISRCSFWSLKHGQITFW